MVWNSTTELGCGLAITDEYKAYAVCNYSPQGNNVGHYQENVFPLSC